MERNMKEAPCPTTSLKDGENCRLAIYPTPINQYLFGRRLVPKSLGLQRNLCVQKINVCDRVRRFARRTECQWKRKRESDIADNPHLFGFQAKGH